MLKSLIPVLTALCCVVTTLHAQVPEPTTVRKVDPAKANMPDACGNDAGTFTIGPKGVSSKTNDVNLPIIFLCANDSVFIDHNGNAAFAGDPDPSTTPGVGWLFYKCPPTIAGDNLIDNILTDPCIQLNLSTIPSTPYVARGDISGDIWFWNNGNQITTFGGGQPVALWFSPTTLDIFSGPGGLGTFEGAGKPGPCVNVNVADAFEVVYLNPIIADNLDNNAGNDCLGRFIIKGGFPQYDKTARYNINITKLNDPTKKALIHTPILQYKHGEPIIFSVAESGQYLIEARDGKSCMLMDTVDMIACDPSDNVTIILPTLTLEPNDSLCLPILVNNYSNLISNSFTIAWDPTILEYDTVARPNNALQFSAVNNLNDLFVGAGTLGFALSRANGSPMTIANGQTLIEVCFKVIGSVGDCTPFTILNNPALIDATKAGAAPGSTVPAAITPINGEICIAYDPLVLKDSIVDFKCDQTASLKVIVEGGQEPFEITYTPLNGGPVDTRTIAKRGEVLLVPGLTNGDWIVCLRDNMGLGQSLCDTINVNVPSIGVNLDFVSPLCFNDKNGKATANVQVNAVPADPTNFTYAWAGTPGPLVQGLQIQNNIGAGNYTVTVTQKSTGCTQVASGSMSQPAKISNNFVVVTDATCSGVDDGSITIITQGGTAFPGTEYDFKWEYSPNGLPPFVNEPKGSGKTNPSVLANVLGGTYKTTITDANGCKFDTTIVVKNTFEIAVELVQIQNPKCFGGTDGVLTVQVKSTPAFPNATWGFTPTIMGTFADSCWATGCKYKNLKAGTIAVQVVEQSGCSDTAIYVLKDPALLSLATVSTKNPSCKGITDGSIEVKAAGGTPAAGNTYTYTWPAPLTPGPIKTNLAEGSYTVTVTDANNCTATLSASITLPLPPKITLIDSTSVKCGKDGSLEVRTNATGVSFQWTNLAGQNLANSAKVDQLDGGQYIYIVKDANDCVSTDTVALGSIIPLFVDTFTINKPKCFGEKNGLIVVSIEGGQKNYSYSWNTTPVQNSPVLTDQGAGKYILTVKDAKGCELKDTFDILNPASMSVGFTDFMPTRCVDTCDGKFTIQVNMSDGSLQDYIFRWEDNLTLNDSIRTGLCIGKYKVTVTDPKSCFAELEITMVGPDSIQIDTFITTPATCNLDKDGTAEVKVKVGSGNGGPYTYRWNTTPLKTQAKITGEPAGAKNVTITDRRGCRKVFSGEIEQPDPIVIQLDNAFTSLPKCFGDSLGSKLQVKVSGGNTGNFTFAWQDENGDPIGGSKNPLENVFAGKYDVTATDSKGCTGAITGLVLSEPPPVIGTFLPFDSLDCFGDETILRVDQIIGGNGGPYKFSVDNGALLNTDFPVTVDGGDHIITYVDKNNCEFSDTINIPEPTELTVKFDPKEIPISLGESTELIPAIDNFYPIKSYTWTPTDSLTRADTSFTTADPTQTIRYKLVVQDIKGCVGSGEVTVVVDPNRDVYIPNIFMPGTSSALNFAFNVNVGPSVQNVNFMQVYNRWGELMYERKDFLPVFGDFGEGWDGRYRGDFVNPGVYIYVAEVTFKDGRVLLYRGDVTIVR